jgi:hypothetical protein
VTLLVFREGVGFRPLPRPSDFFFAGPKKEVTKKKGPSRQYSPATGKTFGIFVLAIHGSVRKRRPSMAAALRVWATRWLVNSKVAGSPLSRG